MTALLKFLVSFGFLLVCILHIMFIISVESNGIKIHFSVCYSFTQDFQHIGKELWRAEAWYLLYGCQNMNCFPWLHLSEYSSLSCFCSLFRWIQFNINHIWRWIMNCRIYEIASWDFSLIITYKNYVSEYFCW